MREIELTRGKVALIDDEDHEWLSGFKWYCSRRSHTSYAVRNKTGQKGTVYMHRAILERHRMGGKSTDHINHNGLDNRKENLRSVSQGQNTKNCRRHKTNTSGFIGVTKINGRSLKKPWAASIHAGKSIHLGYYGTREDAACAYDKAAKKYHGEFATFNFP